MRKFLVLFLFSLLTATLSQAQSPALEYLNFLRENMDPVTKDTWDYMSSIAKSRGAKKIETRRKELLGSLRSAELRIQSRKALEGGEDLKNTTVEILAKQYAILNDDYAKIVDMEEIAERSYDAMEAYILMQDKASEKMNEASASYEAAIDKFAAANTITLIEDQSKMGKKIERAGKAMDYYNVVFLIFFKANVQDASMVAAQNAADVNTMAQSRDALLKYAEEGLAKLEQTPLYENDAILVNECRLFLNFYKKTAEEKVPEIMDFFLKKETFETLNTEMSQKKKSELTKEFVDDYNKAVKEYNGSVESFNKLNNEMNAERTARNNGWNNAVKKFMDKYAA